MKVFPIICKTNIKELNKSPYTCSLSAYAIIKLNEILETMDIDGKDVIDIKTIRTEEGPGYGYVELCAYTRVSNEKYKEYLEALSDD